MRVLFSIIAAHFVLWSGTLQFKELQNLTASDAKANDQFGASVTIEGDTIVIGANYSDDAGTNSGSPFFYL